MRNLKKILALVLALIMSLSLMATAGAAQFPDVDDSNPYKTAIDVLDELKVFQGFEDGTFKPTDTLNRAQAAVLVYRISTGDVDNKYLDNYTDMAQSKFTDLDGYNWARGYINYCQNAEIVKGTSATTFEPGAKVTGYQLMVMVLRALGYGKAGEFNDPKGWELQTAAIAEREGILKNVTGGDFHAAAPRQMVAEILFRGILHDTVEYSPLTPGGYTNSGETLGKRELNLDDVKGVVVANHIADLYDTEPLTEGKTRMIVDGADYMLDIDTDAAAIGLTHHAYVQNGKVLAGLEAVDNAIGEPEHGEASKVAGLAKNVGIKTTADTEYFLNFDPVLKDTSDWRIEYKAPKSLVDGSIRLEYTDAQLNANGCEWNAETNMWTKLIRVGNKITAMDLAILQEIFEYDSKGIDGKVYAGTDVTTDRSDEMTWKTFRKEFLNIDEKDSITSSDNGEWLRVIDNNGDGEVDYVLRTDFVMTTITDYEKRTDVYDVEWNGGLPNGNGEGKIPASAIIKASEDTDLSVGSVILYTLIDGNYYVSNPVVQTLKIDKKSIDSKKGTFTSDSETYTWSGIEEEAVRYYDSVSQLAYETNYEMYPDHFGFIRLATESSRNFVLLTDGYFYTDNRNPEYKADLWNGETAVEGVDVVDHGERDLYYDDDGVTVTREEGFIDTFEADHKGNAGTWKRLNTFGEFYNLVNDDGKATPDNYWVHYVDANDGPSSAGKWNYYNDPFVTNIALGSETDGKWTLEDVENLDVDYNGLYRDYKAYELAGTDITFNSSVERRSLTAKSTDLWGVTAWNGTTPITEQAIQTNGQTLYYLVTDPGTKDQDVKSWVGYKNMPEDLGKNITPVRAYAVTHEVADINAHYVIADVVVLEGVYGKSIANPQLIINGVTPKREIALGRDGEGVYGEHDTEYSLFTRDQLRAIPTDDNGVPYGKDGLVGPQVSFYDPIAEGYIVEDFADYGIYAGFVTVITETKNSDYIELTPSGSIYDKRYSFETDEVVVFELDQDTDYDGNATKNLNANKHENIKMGDQLIVMCDADGNVKLVVNVSRSGKNGNPYRDGNGNWDDKYVIEKLLDLHDYIVAEQKENSKSVAEKLAEAKAVWDKKDDPANPSLAGELEAALALLQTITADEIADMTHANYTLYNTMLTGLPGAINDAVVAEETAAALEELYEYAGEAILAVIGDSWTELPEGVESYEDLLSYDFANDENLSETQVNKIEAIVAAVEVAETSMADVEIPDEAQGGTVPEQVASIHDNIVTILNTAAESINNAGAGAPDEVEPDTMAPSGVPSGVTVEQKEEAGEIVDSHENVTNAYEVTIPANYGKDVKFEISVPEGQTPYVDNESLPTGVTSVTFTKKTAQTLAAVAAVVWEVEIVVNTETQSSDAVVDILLLDSGSAPVEKPLTIDVEAVTARLWDTSEGDDSGAANNLYSSYSVSMTEDTTKENTWDVSIKASDVVKHANASSTEAYWVGVAFLPTVNKGTVTGATLYIADAESGALVADTDCTFGPAMIEVAGGKGEEVENLIAEYFSCDASSNADFSKTYKVVVQWTVTDAEGAETTVRHTYNVSVEITKQLTADAA